MSFYGGLQQTASKLLAKFGKPVTVSVLTGNGYDPVLLTNTETFEDVIGNAVTVPISAKEMQDSLILAGDIKLIIENITPAPTVGSTIVNNGIKYRAEMIEPLNPADTSLIYTCIMRK